MGHLLEPLGPLRKGAHPSLGSSVRLYLVIYKTKMFKCVISLKKFCGFVYSFSFGTLVSVIHHQSGNFSECHREKGTRIIIFTVILDSSQTLLLDLLHQLGLESSANLA